MKSLRYPNAMAGKESTLTITLGLAATTKPCSNGEKADSPKRWINPIVDARQGAYRSSRGRMAREDPNGSSNEKIVMDPYETIHDNDKAWKGQIG
jgi:hypothetical protein